jgi:hypothetical protein
VTPDTGRRFRLGLPAVALVLGGLVLALLIAAFPWPAWRTRA